MNDKVLKIKNELIKLKGALRNIEHDQFLLKQKVHAHQNSLASMLDEQCQHKNNFSVHDPKSMVPPFGEKIYYCNDCGYRITKHGSFNSIKLPLEEIPNIRESSIKKEAQEIIDRVKSGEDKDRMSSLINTTSGYPSVYQHTRSRNPIADSINEKCKHVNKLVKKGGNPYKLRCGDPLYCGDCGYKLISTGSSWVVSELITPPENEKLEIWKDGK